MAYSLERDETLDDGLQRIARSQVRKLVRHLEEPGRLGLAESVHDARKRCKKLRALARLVHPPLGDLYSSTNEAFRDAARELSDIRDPQVAVETFDTLLAAAPKGIELPDLRGAREELVRRHEAVTERLAEDRRPLERARQLVDEGWELVRGWQVDDDFESMAGGISRTYGRARNAYHDCLDTPTVEAFHEWRKRAKYHRYHLQLLSAAAPALSEAWVVRAHDLSDVLGDDHDLAELAATLRAEPDAFGGDDVVDAVVVLADGRSGSLRRRAVGLGARITAEQPDAVVDRLRCWWTAWKAHGDAPERTELADFAGDSLPDLTAKELRQLASEREVTGRSRMRRDDLEAVVRAAGGDRT